MKYVILRAVCKFSDGSLRTIKYDENHVTEENACNDIAQFKKNLKDKLNQPLHTLFPYTTLFRYRKSVV